jgi:hypothetical protein
MADRRPLTVDPCRVLQPECQVHRAVSLLHRGPGTPVAGATLRVRNVPRQSRRLPTIDGPATRRPPPGRDTGDATHGATLTTRRLAYAWIDLAIGTDERLRLRLTRFFAASAVYALLFTAGAAGGLVAAAGCAPAVGDRRYQQLAHAGVLCGIAHGLEPAPARPRDDAGAVRLCHCRHGTGLCAVAAGAWCHADPDGAGATVRCLHAAAP